MIVQVGLRHSNESYHYRLRRQSKTTILQKTPNDFIQCTIQKIFKENGTKVTKTCINNGGLGHSGACEYFKVVKKKW